MSDDMRDGAPAIEAVTLAQELYRRLAQELRRQIAALDSGGVGDQSVMWRVAKARWCHAQLRSLLAMEADLGRTSDTPGAEDTGATLDLDAARAEISERLSRLAALRSDDGASR